MHVLCEITEQSYRNAQTQRRRMNKFCSRGQIVRLSSQALVVCRYKAMATGPRHPEGWVLGLPEACTLPPGLLKQ